MCVCVCCIRNIIINQNIFVFSVRIFPIFQLISQQPKKKMCNLYSRQKCVSRTTKNRNCDTMIDMSILEFSTSRPHNLLTIHKRQQINKIHSFAISFCNKTDIHSYELVRHIHNSCVCTTWSPHMQVVHSKVVCVFFFDN